VRFVIRCEQEERKLRHMLVDILALLPPTGNLPASPAPIHRSQGPAEFAAHLQAKARQSVSNAGVDLNLRRDWLVKGAGHHHP
jgi:hypothetical protein